MFDDVSVAAAVNAGGDVTIPGAGYNEVPVDDDGTVVACCVVALDDVTTFRANPADTLCVA